MKRVVVSRVIVSEVVVSIVIVSRVIASRVAISRVIVSRTIGSDVIASRVIVTMAIVGRVRVSRVVAAQSVLLGTLEAEDIKHKHMYMCMHTCTYMSCSCIYMHICTTAEVVLVCINITSKISKPKTSSSPMKRLDGVSLFESDSFTRRTSRSKIRW